MIKLKYKVTSIFSFFLWILLLSGYPSIFSFACGIPYMLPLLFSALCLCVLLLYKQQKKTFLVVDFIFILNLLFWGAQLLLRNDYSYISNIIQIVLIYIFYLSVLNGVSIYSFSKQYVYLIVSVAVIGAISMCLIFLFNIPPLFSYAAHDGRDAFIFPFTATNVYYQLPHPIIRFSGIFDEPGALAFYSMFALLINRYTIKSKKIERVLLLAPILTFSVAHLVTVLLYAILFKLFKIKYYIIAILLIISSISLIYSLKDTEFNAIYKLTLYRFEQDNDGQMQGDNRTDNAKNALEYFAQKPIVGFGKSYFENNTGDVGFNFFYIGAMYGILGYFFIYSFLGWGISKAIRSYRTRQNGESLKCYFLILVNMTQRPLITNVLEVSVVILFIFAVNYPTYHIKKNTYVEA